VCDVCVACIQGKQAKVPPAYLSLCFYWWLGLRCVDLGVGFLILVTCSRPIFLSSSSSLSCSVANLPRCVQFGERPWYRHVCALGAVINIMLMMAANLVGFVVGVEGVSFFGSQLFGTFEGGFCFARFIVSILVWFSPWPRPSSRRAIFGRSCVLLVCRCSVDVWVSVSPCPGVWNDVVLIFDVFFVEGRRRWGEGFFVGVRLCYVRLVVSERRIDDILRFLSQVTFWFEGSCI